MNFAINELIHRIMDRHFRLEFNISIMPDKAVAEINLQRDSLFLRCRLSRDFGIKKKQAHREKQGLAGPAYVWRMLNMFLHGI